MSGAAPNRAAGEPPVLIELPNRLRERMGGSMDPALASRAEAAISSMAGDFQQWLEETVDLMVKARQALGNSPLTAPACHGLYIATLEVKSLGGTYGYPVISRFAHSLVRLLARLPADRAAPAELVDAHIDAIRAALRSRMTAPADPVGTSLAVELERQVAGFLR